MKDSNNPSETDEEIAEKERQRAKLWSRTTLWSLLFWFAAGLLSVLAFNLDIPQRLGVWTGLPVAAITWLPMILLVILWTIFVFYRIRFTSTPGALRPGVQRKLVDDVTRRQRSSIIAIILLTLIVVRNQFTWTVSHRFDDWYRPAIFVGYMLMAALMIVLGQGFLSRRYKAANADEVSRALRGRATGVGYIVAMTAMSTDYIFYLFAPQELGPAIMLSMSATFIVPALYYVIADWRAGRDG